MKNKIRLCLFLLSLLCMVQGTGAFAEDSAIRSWVVTSNDETAEVRLDNENALDGYASLYVSTEQTEENNSGLTTRIYQKATGLEPSEGYRFSFWCKAEHVKGYTVVRDIFYSTDARADESGSYDWTEVSIDFTTSKSATTAAFQFVISYGDGEKAEVWIDNVSLYKLSDGEPTGENLILNGDFEAGVTKPERGIPDVYADDVNNTIIGIDEKMEYTVDGGQWIAYTDNPEPELEGCHLVKVRYREDDRADAGKYKILVFFKDEVTPENTMRFSAQMKVDEVSLQGTALPGSRVRIAARQAESPHTIVFVTETDAGSDGGFAGKFYMPTWAPAGHYLLQCKADDIADAEAAELIYTDRTVLAKLISELKAASENEMNNILSSEQNTDSLISLNVKIDCFLGLSSEDKRLVAAGVYKKRTQLSEENLDGIINSQIALRLIAHSQNSGQVLEMLNEYQPWLNLSMDDVPFESVTDNGLIAWICERTAGKSFESSEEFTAYYKKQCAFYVLNNESYVNIGKVMDKYKSELGIAGNSAYSSYLQLSNTDKETVNRKVKLANSSYYETNTFISALSSAITSSGSSAGIGSTGAGGGGGGGSKVMAAGIGASVVNTTANNADSAAAPGTVNTGEKNLFQDLGSVPWAEKEINALAEKGILLGTGDGIFDPDGVVTREQLAVMTARAFGVSISDEAASPFSDVTDDRWSYPQIMAMKQSGIINGYDDGTFLPEDNITREDMVLILYRAMEKQKGTPDKIREIAEFNDWEDISVYARDSIYEMYCMGLVNGVGDAEFMPKGTATRAMAAKILYDIIEGTEN